MITPDTSRSILPRRRRIAHAQSDQAGSFYCAAFPNTEVHTPEQIAERDALGISVVDPKGIPDEIIFGGNDHSKPISGQVGTFIFTPKPESE